MLHAYHQLFYTACACMNYPIPSKNAHFPVPCPSSCWMRAMRPSVWCWNCDSMLCFSSACTGARNKVIAKIPVLEVRTISYSCAHCCTCACPGPLAPSCSMDPQLTPGPQSKRQADSTTSSRSTAPAPEKAQHRKNSAKSTDSQPHPPARAPPPPPRAP